AVAAAYRRPSVPKRIPGKAKPWSEVFAVIVVNLLPASDEVIERTKCSVKCTIAGLNNCGTTLRKIRRGEMIKLTCGFFESALDPPFDLDWDGIQFVSKTCIDGEISMDLPIVLKEEIVLCQPQADSCIGSRIRCDCLQESRRRSKRRQIRASKQAVVGREDAKRICQAAR